MPDKRTSAWTVVLSGSGREALADCLAHEHGLDLLVIPDIGDLPEDHVALAAVRELTGPLCVASDYPPRAAYWLLAWHGLRGRRADLADTTTAGRRVHPVCLAECSPAEALARVLTITGSPGRRGSVRSVVDQPPQRWYPVIDYDRCTACGACVEFCLFGIYQKQADESIRVVRPDLCKPGCPACGWTCPTGAIMFPRYAEGGPVAGDDAGTPGRLEGPALRQAVSRSIGQWKLRAEQAGDAVDRAIDDLETFNT